MKPEIEVTPEMATAGYDALFDEPSFPDGGKESLCNAVTLAFRAMARVQAAAKIRGPDIFIASGEVAKAIADATIERCAQVAERYFPFGKVNGKEIAAEIRKLKDTP